MIVLWCDSVKLVLKGGGGGVLYSSEFVRPFSNHLLMAMAPFKYKSWMFEKILDVCPEML